ncbi:unnamed protein product [Rotaria sp. Silwood2]|nr:unnamed protein product [Rotaria sp. Silwood2]CAF3361650.1 unnamed protein product [Rotaria sp. Silwood2]CAF4145015.1 unnamed protein product [Rotaria sp. Silwood2]CAF4395217.1 unnamed protein product [Rotaria sp. Silwood2]CAF4419622.1 unnamed protein product [Rotaria sp. Silwood2]
MPSVTDLQQQQQQQQTSSNIHGKSTPPPTQSATSMDPNNADPLTQAMLVLEKKQRNLGKRKEKLESYQKEAKDGKELNKDQKDALAKYPEVLGQIECVKELSEQFKKIQTESSRNQKRLSKQAAEEKRLLVSERLREYAKIRYLFDHRPSSLKPEESSLLDELSSSIIPSDNSLNSITRSVDTVLSIYQAGPSSTIKPLTGKNPQEVREILEELIKNLDNQTNSVSSCVPIKEEEQIKQINETDDIQSSNKNINEYPLQFDTRNQNIPLEQIIQDSPFFPIDLNNQQIQDNNRDQSPDPNQYLQTFTVVNSNINDQSSSSIINQQEEESTNVVTSNDEQHQSDEQWQHQGSNETTQRMGQFHNETGNKNYHRGGPNHFSQQWRGPRGVRYDNSHGSGQRQYNENNRARNGSNQYYRGNRGGGNYRPGNRGYHNNTNEYQKPTQYQTNNDQHQQTRSAPPSQQQ